MQAGRHEFRFSGPCRSKAGPHWPATPVLGGRGWQILGAHCSKRLTKLVKSRIRERPCLKRPRVTEEDILQPYSDHHMCVVGCVHTHAHTHAHARAHTHCSCFYLPIPQSSHQTLPPFPSIRPSEAGFEAGFCPGQCDVDICDSWFESPGSMR